MESQEKKCEPDKHCYHRVGIALLTWPPQYKRICCHCGDVKIEQNFHLKGTEHGPFFRNTS